MDSYSSGVEQRSEKPCVVGSNPTMGRGHLAELVDAIDLKSISFFKSVGSNPIVLTHFMGG